jgi:RNA polymerase sigma factor (sigma-70 family)
LEENVIDAELWAAFKKGDPNAFSQIYGRYIKILYRYGSRINTDGTVVEDAIQDLFVDLWKSRERLSDPDSVKYYLFRVLRRKIVKALSPSENWDEIDENVINLHSYTESSENSFMEAEDKNFRSKKVLDALKMLPARQQEAVNLRYYHGFTSTQIAEIMGISHQSVHNTLQKAMKFLRQVLASNMDLVIISALIFESTF